MSTYLTISDIAVLTGLSRSALYVRRNRGGLPKADIENYQPLWKPETIRKWMDDEGIPRQDRTRTE